jgi:hypothetical protein
VANSMAVPGQPKLLLSPGRIALWYDAFTIDSLAGGTEEAKMFGLASGWISWGLATVSVQDDRSKLGCESW